MALVGFEHLAALLAAWRRRVFVHVALKTGERAELAPTDWTLIVAIG